MEEVNVKAEIYFREKVQSYYKDDIEKFKDLCDLCIALGDNNIE